MTKATVTLRLFTGEVSKKEFLFEHNRDAKQFKKLLEKGALMKKDICTCSVDLELVEMID